MVFGPAPKFGWLYRARCVRIKDGDTLQLLLDRGYFDTSERAVRFAGVNAPELELPDGSPNPPGEAARDWVVAWMAQAELAPPDAKWPLLVESHKPDVHGRWLGIIWRTNDGACLNRMLLEAGHATVAKR